MIPGLVVMSDMALVKGMFRKRHLPLVHPLHAQEPEHRIRLDAGFELSFGIRLAVKSF